MTAQIFIALFGVTAVALSQSALAGRRRWASVFGLLGQPFWFYAAWEAQQWGIFTLCFLYTISWGKGFHTNWIAASKQGASKEQTMTTPELLSLMRLLSAMESAMLTAGKALPDHIWDDVTRHVEILEREILKRANHD